MWKYAGELRVGDVLIERTGGHGAHSYRVIAIEPSPPLTTMVTGSCVITRQRRTMEFFVFSRAEVWDEDLSTPEQHCITGPDATEEVVSGTDGG